MFIGIHKTSQTKRRKTHKRQYKGYLEKDSVAWFLRFFQELTVSLLLGTSSCTCSRTLVKTFKFEQFSFRWKNWDSLGHEFKIFRHTSTRLRTLSIDSTLQRHSYIFATQNELFWIWMKPHSNIRTTEVSHGLKINRQGESSTESTTQVGHYWRA